MLSSAEAIAGADEWTREADAALALLDETMAWLLAACGQVQRAGLRPEPPPAQPKRQACANCARFGLDVDLADTGGRLCGQCKDFRRNHKVMPHEAICRAWANGTNRITPAHRRSQGPRPPQAQPGSVTRMLDGALTSTYGVRQLSATRGPVPGSLLRYQGRQTRWSTR